jgi:cysteine desulfurase/selenocysteine lyase
VLDSGELNLEAMLQSIRRLRPKIVACTQLSNALGVTVPVEPIIAAAHEVGAKVLIDAAQSVAHTAVDVAKLDADFLVFSGHKLYGPTGIGVLYAKEALLESMDPFMGGGDMIREVTVQGSTWADIPAKFEAGTPPIAEAVALGTAIEFISSLQMEHIHAYERELFLYALELLRREPGVTLYGPLDAEKQTSILSFNVEGVHAHDFSTIADSFNVQVRAGHHCAMPLMTRLGLVASARVSLGVYSTKDDFPPLLEAIRYARKMFS